MEAYLDRAVVRDDRASDSSVEHEDSFRWHCDADDGVAVVVADVVVADAAGVVVVLDRGDEVHANGPCSSVDSPSYSLRAGCHW